MPMLTATRIGIIHLSVVPVPYFLWVALLTRRDFKHYVSGLCCHNVGCYHNRLATLGITIQYADIIRKNTNHLLAATPLSSFDIGTNAKHRHGTITLRKMQKCPLQGKRGSFHKYFLLNFLVAQILLLSLSVSNKVHDK